MDPQLSIVQMTVSIVSAFVSKNALETDDLPKLIKTVYAALCSASDGTREPSFEAAAPAVAIKKSVTSEYLICLEDGQRFRSLRRHLLTHHQLTPDQYRKKWGLAPDYPMVSPGYAETRSRLAKQMGLGLRESQPRPKRAGSRNA